MSVTLRLASSVCLAALVTASPAGAQSFTIPSGGTAVATQTMSGAGDVGIVQAGGAIAVVGFGVRAQADDQTLRNFGAIETMGAFHHGVFWTGARASFSSFGTISTNGFDADGLRITGADAWIVNGGSITTQRWSSNGIGVEPSAVGARVLNSGTIRTLDDPAVLNDNSYGIWARAPQATIENTGLVETFGRTSHGIRSTGSDVSVLNSGTIATFGDAANAVRLEGPNARLVNSGTLATSGRNVGALGANAVAVASPDANVLNTGRIVTTGEQSAAVDILSLAPNAVLENAGSIATSGTQAHAVSIRGNGTRVTNTGRIEATGEQGVGIFAIANDVTVVNSGTIRGPTSRSVILNGTNNRLELAATSVLEGRIVFSSPATASLAIEPGWNGVLAFDGVPASITTGGMPFVASDTQVAFVDPTPFAALADVLADTTDAATDALDGRAADLRRCRAEPGAAEAACARGIWVAPFGAYRSGEGSGPRLDFEHAFGGLVAGFDRPLADGSRIGLHVGGTWGALDVPHSTQADTASAFAGLSWSRAPAPVFVAASASLGWLGLETRRRVANTAASGGLETARADADGLVVAPSVTVGRRLPFAAGTLTPSLRARYAGLFLGDTSETGTLDPMTIDARDLHLLALRGRLAWETPTFRTAQGVLSATFHVDAEGLLQTGGEVDAMLIGQALSFDPGAEAHVVRGSAGIDVAYETAGGLRLVAAADFGLASDGARTVRVGGRIGMRF